jgi:hypothetical protein
MKSGNMRSGHVEYGDMKPRDVSRQPVGATQSFDGREKPCASH